MPFQESQQLSWIHELYRLGQSDMLRDSPEVVLDRILQHIVNGFEAASGSLALRQGEENDRLTICAGIGLPPACIGSEIEAGTGIIGWVVENGQAVLLNGDVGSDPRFRGKVAKKASTIPMSAMCWPLMLDNRVLGALSVNSKPENPPYTEDDLEHGRVLVNLIALVVDNTRLHSEQQQRIDLLASLNERYSETNRKLEDAHSRLKQSEDRLNGILGSLNDVVWSLTPGSLEVIYLNPAAERVYGRPISAFTENAALWLDIVDSRDRERVAQSLTELNSTDVLALNYRIVRPNGDVRWIHDQMRMVYDDSGKPVRLDGSAADVTEHKLAEDMVKKRNEELQEALDKLREVQGQLLQSEKMASVGQLAAGVAHEINNPIGYVSSNIGSLEGYVGDLLGLLDLYEKAEASLANDEEALQQIRQTKRKVDLDFLKEDVMSLLSESREGTSRVKKIVQDLKDFSHLGSEDDWQWANLHAGLDSTLNIVHNEIKYKAEVVKNFGELPEVQCLPFQLNQVFMNLLVNAGHAIENNGRIVINTGSENGRVWIEISDNGKGIAPEHVSKIFDPFFTTKPVGKGTGLGLSVSYSIIQKHKGEIQVNSDLGRGTTFRILLPVEQSMEQA